VANPTHMFFSMDFPERLATLRKERGMTQQVLADRIGIPVLQIRRYEGGSSQPTVDTIRRLAIALTVSADMLIFDAQERGPDDRLRHQFEAVSQLQDDEQTVVREVLDGLIIKYQTRRWDSTRPQKADAA
jgi:transcriptional regulator with XRE-family HTH domain